MRAEPVGKYYYRALLKKETCLIKKEFPFMYVHPLSLSLAEDEMSLVVSPAAGSSSRLGASFVSYGILILSFVAFVA